MLVLTRGCLLLLIACKEFVPVPEGAGVRKDSAPIVTENKQRGEFAAYLEKLSGLKRLQAKVDPNRLTIDFITAGVQSNKYGKFVRLYFHADIQRDYLEIARCNSSIDNLQCLFGKDLRSTVITKDDVERFRKLMAGDTPTANESGKYDCWNQMIIQCQELDGWAFGAEHHIDFTVGDGDFFYIARPCLREERINEIYASDSQRCSNDFAVSTSVNYANNNDTKRKELQATINGLTRELNERTHRVYLLTVELSKVMEDHEEEMIENQRKRRMREGIAMIAGMAIGVAGSMYSMSHADPSMLWKSVGKKEIIDGAKTRVLEGGELQQLVEHNPAASDAVGAGLEAGKALGAAFADILASPDDYPKTCTECMNIRADIAETVGDMDSTNPNDQHGGYLYRELLQKYQDAYRELQELNASAWDTERWTQQTEKEQADEQTAE